MRWLMERYDVRAVAVTVADGGRVAWRATHGGGEILPAPSLDQSLLDSLASSDRPDTLHLSWQDTAADVVLLAVLPAAGVSGWREGAGADGNSRSTSLRRSLSGIAGGCCRDR